MPTPLVSVSGGLLLPHPSPGCGKVLGPRWPLRAGPCGPCPARPAAVTDMLGLEG